MGEQFTKRDLEEAVSDLGMLPFFPRESAASVMMLLAKLCNNRQQLRWLIDEVVNKIGTWPGPKELRGIFCTKFDPADGVDAWSEIPGYRASDGEARSLEAHEQIKTQAQIGGYVEPTDVTLKALLKAAAQKRIA
jgi:hypothetical protein